MMNGAAYIGPRERQYTQQQNAVGLERGEIYRQIGAAAYSTQYQISSGRYAANNYRSAGSASLAQVTGGYRSAIDSLLQEEASLGRQRAEFMRQSLTIPSPPSAPLDSDRSRRFARQIAERAEQDRLMRRRAVGGGMAAGAVIGGAIGSVPGAAIGTAVGGYVVKPYLDAMAQLRFHQNSIDRVSQGTTSAGLISRAESLRAQGGAALAQQIYVRGEAQKLGLSEISSKVQDRNRGITARLNQVRAAERYVGQIKQVQDNTILGLAERPTFEVRAANKRFAQFKAGGKLPTPQEMQGLFGWMVRNSAPDLRSGFIGRFAKENPAIAESNRLMGFPSEIGSAEQKVKEFQAALQGYADTTQQEIDQLTKVFSNFVNQTAALVKSQQLEGENKLSVTRNQTLENILTRLNNWPA